jgi:hypothetical protein
MRIGVLSNLKAGRQRPPTTRLLTALRGVPVEHVETQHAAQVADALHELGKRDVDLLLVNGGDGTLQHALTALLHDDAFGGRLPLVAPLRGGRTNTSALDLGVSRDPARVVARLLEAEWAGRLHEHTVERRVLRVELRDGLEREVRYGMFFGCGVIHRGIAWVHQHLPSGRSRGVFGSALVTGGLVSRLALLGDGGGMLAPDKIQMLVDGFPLERGESRLAMATTLDRLFLGLRPFWGEGPGGVRFTAISSKARHLARLAPGILAGRPGSGVSEANGYLSRNARRVALLLSCGLTIDGELLAPEPDRVVSLTADRSLRFVSA